MGIGKHQATKITAGSLLVALGIIYGDIGTSPLYTFKAIIGNRPISEILVLGGVSCVFWTLMLQTTIKYVWLTLKADNDGEGGIFSLYSLVRRYGKKMIIPTMLGAAALLADGIITPAVSVTSAVEGLEMIAILDGHLSVVPIVIAIISLVFFLQRFGTQTVGKAFGPIMAIWFSVLLFLGFQEIIIYPEVFKALNPYYAYALLTQYPHGFWLLGAVFLCTTGAEALYSDLGHCGRGNIRITWGFVKTCLVVNYLGQAAWLLHQGETYLDGKNPFFEMMPSWFLLPGILIATFAAIVASQALISGSFTLINEAINLNFWQRVTVKQPSDTKGQIYIPSVNNMLWIGCTLVILYFQTSSKMEAAYGLAITLAMMTTTMLLSYFLLYKLKWNKTLVFLLLLTFAVIELSFFVANIVKFQEGGYITVIVGGLFFAVMYISFYGRKINNRYTNFVDLGRHAARITQLSDDASVPKMVTHLIYLSKADNRGQIEERIIESIFSKRPKRADVYWFFHINRANTPYTLDYDVTELVDDKVIKNRAEYRLQDTAKDGTLFPDHHR
ncbi:KUP/HAK/KT family potassium transporter [Sphingobacterium oryzagri]|uniref:KUP/HAK/KT family potassium transporter n=1 Tax=Sphingobacterium oryzagri TaxID=3025669 RepID=A0ABY7WLQ6_9SPHI|nr:KUP/HAK/KT family potassium transporter [Sphingobacterium sp. KACC 22765]WDF70532.1 KUP/HAK/KT family potassium transporter [Sphingobacterium sp. KACC 22765]